MSGLFTEQQITDDKRFVRGEHLKLAQYWLRVRDKSHFGKWRVLILAGGQPCEEIEAIKSLMTKAHIVAMDTNKEFVDLAVRCGANEGIVGDVGELLELESKRISYWGASQPGQAYFVKRHVLWTRNSERFDLVDLDFCGTVSETMRKTAWLHFKELASGGCLMLTFSYGRDVEEIGRHNYKKQTGDLRLKPLYLLEDKGAKPGLIGRLITLLCPTLCEKLVSVMTYSGAMMPMCSLFFAKSAEKEDVSFVKVTPGDLEIAACYPQSAPLYAVPEERIAAWRRKHAAIKAHETAKKKRNNALQTPHP